MTDSTYDYRLQCDALQDLLPGQDILVTQWRGTEAVSQLYRFDVTVAVRAANLALETLLDQPATLQLRHPDGSIARWHGIITQGGQHGHDESYDYYQLTIEPRLARLGLRLWSDIYLDQQLDDLIVALLKEGRLTEKYLSADAPYDYRIAVTDQDLAVMRRPFACQFEESCLSFLMRKLEFYGVYFWFEQGEDRESVVFGNDASQQPAQVGNAIYYPKGALDPDARQVVITRMDRHVAMQPATVSLRALHDHDNTRLDMRSVADVSAVPAGRGEVQSVADYFSVLNSDSSGASNGVPGDTLARWRAQEIACQTLQVQGVARTPGVLAGRYLAVSEFQRQAEADQYYVFQVEHEGMQTVETSPGSDDPPYRARFTAMPRWRDQPNQADSVQFRPQRRTPVPRVSRLITGFVDMDAQAGPKRYAQPDGQGRYKVRLPFARSNHGGYRNSAWLRQSTPYAAGASQSGLTAAGMHFPLREGTEVLIAFLNEDPDLPVIVGSLPNAEAPSVVSQNNAREHVIRTPGGSGLSILDGGAGAAASTQEGQSEDSDGMTGYEGDDSQVCVYTPKPNAKLILGTVPPPAAEPGEDPPEQKNGFQLWAEDNGQIHAGKSMLIEVPNHYRMAAGGGGMLNNFLGSSVSLAPGVSASQSASVVFENYIGAKFQSAESSTMAMTVGQATDVFAGFKFGATFAVGATVAWAPIKDLNLVGKKAVWNSKATTGKTLKETLLNVVRTSASSSTRTLDYSVQAYENCTINCTTGVKLESLTAALSVEPTGIDLDATGLAVNVTGGTVDVAAMTSVELKTSTSAFKLAAATTLNAATSLRLSSSGNAAMAGSVIQIG